MGAPTSPLHSAVLWALSLFRHVSDTFTIQKATSNFELLEFPVDRETCAALWDKKAVLCNWGTQENAYFTASAAPS